MEFLKTVLSHPFFWGTMLGLIFAGFSVFSHFRTKGELKRSRAETTKLKGHLADKLEIDAEKVTSMKSEIDDLKKENENMRVQIQVGKVEDSGKSLEKELEIYARAEKAMVLNAPGFAQAWESAKGDAIEEIEEEEAGKNPVKRIFRKFFKGGGEEEQKALPVKVEVSAKEKAEVDSTSSSD